MHYQMYADKASNGTLEQKEEPPLIGTLPFHNYIFHFYTVGRSRCAAEINPA